MFLSIHLDLSVFSYELNRATLIWKLSIFWNFLIGFYLWKRASIFYICYFIYSHKWHNLILITIGIFQVPFFHWIFFFFHRLQVVATASWLPILLWRSWNKNLIVTDIQAYSNFLQQPVTLVNQVYITHFPKVSTLYFLLYIKSMC